MSWSREQVTTLLNELPKYSRLYAVKSEQYKNKHARTKALKSLQEILPEKSLEDIKTKIHGLRTTFASEHRKYINAIKSGAGEEDIEIYKPTLWYYDLLLFLLDHLEIRQGRDNVELHENTASTENHLHFQRNDESFSEIAGSPSYSMENENSMENTTDSVYELDEQTMTFKKVSENIDNTDKKKLSETEIALTPKAKDKTVSQSVALVASNTQLKKPIKRTKIDTTLDEASGAMKMLSAAIGQSKFPKSLPKERDEFETFGDFVAQKLRKMVPEVAEQAEERITHILFEAVKPSKQY